MRVSNVNKLLTVLLPPEAADAIYVKGGLCTGCPCAWRFRPK